MKFIKKTLSIFIFLGMGLSFTCLSSTDKKKTIDAIERVANIGTKEQVENLQESLLNRDNLEVSFELNGQSYQYDFGKDQIRFTLLGKLSKRMDIINSKEKAGLVREYEKAGEFSLIWGGGPLLFTMVFASFVFWVTYETESFSDNLNNKKEEPSLPEEEEDR